MPILPCRVRPERNAVTSSASSGGRPRKRDARSSIFSRRLEVSAIRLEVSTTLASSMLLFLLLFLPVRRDRWTVASWACPTTEDAKDTFGSEQRSAQMFSFAQQFPNAV